MMMKLMKFLVVALVAGGVCAPVPSQAGEVDGKAIMCELSPNWLGEPWSDEDKKSGDGLNAFHFESGLAVGRSLLGRTIYRFPSIRKYLAFRDRITWQGPDMNKHYSLNRKTLQLEVTGDSYQKTERKQHGQCELIDPDKIEAYFLPYLDYKDALDAKIRAENKI